MDLRMKLAALEINLASFLALYIEAKNTKDIQKLSLVAVEMERTVGAINQTIEELKNGKGL